MSFLLTLLQTTLRRNPWRMLERNLKICLDKCTMRSLKRRISGTVMQQCNLNVTNIQTISTKSLLDEKDLEMFYLNTIQQLFLFVEQLDQSEVCLPYSRLQSGISILAVFYNLRWNSNKTSLCCKNIHSIYRSQFFMQIVEQGGDITKYPWTAKSRAH